MEARIDFIGALTKVGEVQALEARGGWMRGLTGRHKNKKEGMGKRGGQMLRLCC